MKRFVFLLAVVLSVTCLFSFAFAEEVQGFNISLVATPSTGYEWEITFSDDDIAHIEGEYVELESDEDMEGVTGFYDYVLLGDKEGYGLLTLRYMRPGDESTVITTQIFSFAVDADMHIQILACGTLVQQP